MTAVSLLKITILITTYGTFVKIDYDYILGHKANFNKNQTIPFMEYSLWSQSYVRNQ